MSEAIPIASSLPGFLSVYFALDEHPAVSLLLLAGGLGGTWLRVRLGYHSVAQVAVGCLAFVGAPFESFGAGVSAPVPGMWRPAGLSGRSEPSTASEPSLAGSDADGRGGDSGQLPSARHDESGALRAMREPCASHACRISLTSTS